MNMGDHRLIVIFVVSKHARVAHAWVEEIRSSKDSRMLMTGMALHQNIYYLLPFNGSIFVAFSTFESRLEKLKTTKRGSLTDQLRLLSRSTDRQAE